MDRLLNEANAITRVCLLAGKIMLQNGAETYRVEDTMTRIAASFGMPDSHSYVTPTAIIFAIEGEVSTTKLLRISVRSTDLKKVTLVNDISRRISARQLSIEEAYRKLQMLDTANLAYSVWMQIAAAALASGCFLIMFQGIWGDFIPALLAGAGGYACLLLLQRLMPIKFFAEFLASLLIGSVSFLFVKYGIGRDLDKIIIGSVMPLVPGLAITNAVRDLMAGHLASGIAKGAEAFLTAFAIGAGVAFVLSVY